MATRSLTFSFGAYRQQRHSNGKATSDPPESEILSLVNAAPFESQSVDCVYGNMLALPEKWLRMHQTLETSITNIDLELTRLEALHKKHLLPGFEDQTSIEHSIEKLTQQIVVYFRDLHNIIKSFQHLQFNEFPDKSNVLVNDTENALQLQKFHANVLKSQARKISILSTKFRKVQTNYLTKLQISSCKSSPMLDPDESPKDVANKSMNGFQFEKIQQPLGISNSALEQYERDVSQIANTIQDIVSIFQDLQTLIIDQGSILDRVDFHINEASQQISNANRELQKTAEIIVSSRKKQLIFLLILSIGLLVLFLVLKSKNV